MDLEKNDTPVCLHCTEHPPKRPIPHTLLRVGLALAAMTIFYVLPFDQIANALASKYFYDEEILDEAFRQLVEEENLTAKWAQTMSQSGIVLSFSKAWLGAAVSLAIFAPGSKDCLLAMGMACMLTTLCLVTSLMLCPS